MKTRNCNPMINHAHSYLIVAFILILASCSSNTERIASDASITEYISNGSLVLTTKQFHSSKMKLGRLQQSAFHDVVKANGIFDVPPENRAEVSCYFGGAVKEIKLLPGEQVKKGQVLFILENPEYIQMQQDYLEAKGQLAYLKSDYERQKNLAEDHVTSQKTYLKAEADYTVTRVKVESLGKQLSLMNINPTTLTLDNIRTTVNVLSPINGYVTEVAISKGVFLNPSTLAVSIVDTDHMHLELNIFEKDLGKVEIGQAIQFRTQNDPRIKYDATVHLVNKIVEIENRTIGIHCHLSDEKQTSKFNPGMYVEAEIYIDSSSGVSLPHDALVDIEGNNYVLVLQNTSDSSFVFEKREVQTGLSNSTHIEILNSEEFNEGAQFLIKGAFNLITE